MVLSLGYGHAVPWLMVIPLRFPGILSCQQPQSRPEILQRDSNNIKSQKDRSLTPYNLLENLLSDPLLGEVSRNLAGHKGAIVIFPQGN